MFRRMAAFLLALMIVSVVPMAARGAEQIDTAHRCTLDVSFSMDGEDITGMRFDLYRVAEVLEDGSTRLCVNFQSLGTAPSLTPNDTWAASATVAANMVRRTGMLPEQSVALNEHGVAHFPQTGSILTPGIYLVFPQLMETGGKRIWVSPTLVELPLADGGWNYDVSLKPKGGYLTADDKLEVQKIWQDDQHEDKRPAAVVVDLYCDDVLVDTQTLTADTGWNYTWYPAPVWKTQGQAGNGPGSDVTIEGEHSWYVVEREVDGYDTTYALSDSRRIVIINTVRAKAPPEGGKLPQTGVLWWPVPILLLAGLSLMYLGRVADKKEREYE